jgi:outer membrane protein assembly factor BamB
MRTFLLAFLIAIPTSAAEPWSTYRGNPARTGSTDGVAVPDSPKILWAIKANDQFIASPVPVGDGVYLSRLGAFNQPRLGVYPLASAGEPKAVWTKAVPYLRLASVSSPSVGGNLLVFGDGMHQDAGGTLHGVAADTGRPLWQLPMLGDLVHLEGAPAIANGKIYMGGGAAGAFCVDPSALALDGKPVAAADVPKLQEAKRKELLAKYEAEKKVDPATAVPPSDDDLLKPAPKVVWRKGEKKWHVDAPVNVVGDRVLVCTSFLDAEKVGERALYCLNATTGDTLWTKPLRFNPWGGASVIGDTAVVAGSSVGYYYTQLKGAKGDVTAFDLKTGDEKWRKEVPAGIVGCVALTEELAICTATDGKVRAFALADGERRWIYDAKTPVFAPPAIAGGAVYVGDLQGAIHAIDLKTGNGKLIVDLGKDPATSSPGMIYGGPIVVGGKLVVATCNLEGPFARKPTCVVGIGK